MQVRSISIAVLFAAVAFAASSPASAHEDSVSVQLEQCDTSPHPGECVDYLLKKYPSAQSQIPVSNLQEKITTGEVVLSPLVQPTTQPSYTYDNSKTGDGRPAIMQGVTCLNCRGDQ